MRPGYFFVLRTPLLPLSDLLSERVHAAPRATSEGELERALAADVDAARSRLRALLALPAVRDALYVGAPDLEAALPAWEREPDGRRGQRAERALVRYLARMAARPTPFGLFAGCTTGTVGHEGFSSRSTTLRLQPARSYRRHSRLDLGLLEALADRLRRDPAVRQQLVHRPNPTLQRAAGQWRYVEWRRAAGGRTYHLAAIEADAAVDRVLRRAATGARTAELVAALAETGHAADEAAPYVEALIDAQMLLPDLDLALTSGARDADLQAQLAPLPAAAAARATIAVAVDRLAAIDARGPGAPPAAYRAVVAPLPAIDGPMASKHFVHVDLFKPTSAAVLGSDVVAALEHGVDVLRRLAAPRDDLASFRSAFAERWGEREVPLLLALDEDLGVGFGRRRADGAAGELAGAERLAGPLHRLLLRKLAEGWARGAPELELTAADLATLQAPGATLPGLPAALSVKAAVVASPSPDAPAVRLDGASTGTGAEWFGRFCAGDPELRAAVVRQLAAMAATDPEAIHAEVVHLPDGRTGNVLCRPPLLEWEIPLLGRSAVPPERQIALSDLTVSVRGDRTTLRSTRLGRRVVPRLSTAHAYAAHTLPLYHFLCALQREGTAANLAWRWGELAAAPFLPRVRSGRCVLARASWRLERGDLAPLAAPTRSGRFTAVQALRHRLRLPRLVVLADGDNELAVDLDDALAAEGFAHQASRRQEVALLELFPGPEELAVVGPEGRFVHEIVVPFFTGEPARPPLASAAAKPGRRTGRAAPRPTRRSFPPGSEWLYVKLYSGLATLDRLIAGPVAALVERAIRRGAAGWFFVRYADPDPHLRLRFRGTPSALHRQVWPAIRAELPHLLDEGWIWRVQLDSYEREVERYGGSASIAVAEAIFEADSDAVLEILRQLPTGDAAAAPRRQLALLGIDALYADFGLELAARQATSRRLSRADGPGDREWRDELATAVRAERPTLFPLLATGGEDTPALAAGVAALRARSARLGPLVDQLRELEAAGALTRPVRDLVPVFAHMFVNRLLRTQTLVEKRLHDLLARFYGEQLARPGRQGGDPQVPDGESPAGPPSPIS